VPENVSNSLIFVSCGQVTASEKALGNSIRDTIDNETQFRAYFAENQMDLEGLTSHIFRNLYECDGLITVTHPRGLVTGLGGKTRNRASVWIEQEIAIASFMRHVLKRNIQVAVFMHSDVAIEGVREKLLLNPIRFARDEEVLPHVRKIVRGWQPLRRIQQYDVSYRYVRQEINAALSLRQYRLEFFIINSGETRATDYRLEVDFPAGLLVGTQGAAGFRTFRFSEDMVNERHRTLYAGDERPAFGFEYLIDVRQWDDVSMLHDGRVSVRLHSGDMQPKFEKLPLVDPGTMF
jgi:hypothetical protein